jgi:hypothetical protein
MERVIHVYTSSIHAIHPAGKTLDYSQYPSLCHFRLAHSRYRKVLLASVLNSQCRKMLLASIKERRTRRKNLKYLGKY